MPKHMSRPLAQSNNHHHGHQFVKYARSSKDRPVLLLLDNHDSHLSIEALNFFKENGVTVCSFPPHCSHKLQPLHCTVFGPFKKYINTACDAWITNHSSKTMNIYNISGIVKTALPQACTPINIKAGPNPDPESTVENEVGPTIIPENDKPEARCSKDSVSTFSVLSPRDTGAPMISAEDVGPLTPEDVRSLKTAESRKKTGKNRRWKKGTTTILTDSPNLKALKEKKESLERKKLKYKREEMKGNRKSWPKIGRSSRKLCFHLQKKRIIEKSTNLDNSSDDEECYCLVCVGSFKNS
ncbi:hypothetical protein AVEN_123801-1 [Araneus ventricosus]|uniref:DDE-1 domain-containing protein n=1 Tax=Araneus ventricosus TaxID=182803 RepID=A0A4Y2BK82_ARAVE|nr:hypothetical protein AVEN_123801-1 [Araneus ventricosus]